MQTATLFPMPIAPPIPAASHPHRNRPAPASNEPTSDARWQQVLARDPAAQGSFVYAVRSTKIYCRPACPSRRPAQRNVAFFSTPADAQRAGYRACKRCSPDQPSAPNRDAALVAHATAHLTRHAAAPVRLVDLARATGANRLTLLRAFRRILGLTPAEYARTQRLALFQSALRPEPRTLSNRKDARTPSTPKPPHNPSARSDPPTSPTRSAQTPKPARSAPAPKPARITDAIYQAGFGSSSRLYESGTRALGMTPRALRAGAPGLAIRYTTASSPLGRTLVAATDAGVCAIAFASTDAELLADLRARFPRAQLTRATSAGWLADAVAFILSHTTENPLAAAFPLDVRATAFQQRVWKALQQVPRGQTRSYSQIAHSLGAPRSTRAVASACAANPVALVVPCHRIVGKDGSLTGYRWGLDRKRKLLAAEQSPPNH